MRTAITLGITKNGKAEIIHQPSVSIHIHRREINELASKKGNSKYKEIQLWESGRGLRRRVRVGEAAKNENVDFNAAHRVDHQQDKKKAKALPGLAPSIGNTGGVDFNAAHLVDHQQDKKKSKTLSDLNAKQTAGKKESSKKQGVNFEAAKRIGETKDEKPGIERVRGSKGSHRDSRSKIVKHVSKKKRISDAASAKKSTETDTTVASPEPEL
jgi:hypothetical protein